MNITLPSAVSKNTYDPHIFTLPYGNPSTHGGRLYIRSKSPRVQSYVAFTSVTFFKFFIYLYLWLCWVFVAARGLSLVVVSRE